MRIQNSRGKISPKIRHIAVYLLLLFTSGFHIYSKGYHIPVMLAVALILFALSEKQIDIKLLLTVMAMVLIIIISGMINDEIARNILVPAMDLLCGAIIAFSALGGENKTDFLNIYRKIILVIAVGSIILFVLGIVANSAFRIFPLFQQNQHQAYFTGLSFVYKNRQYVHQRNMGIFWEPGAFQTYLIIAMIFEDCIDHKRKIWHLLIYSIAILTTISTTGIICLLLFWIVYILKNDKKTVSLLMGLVVLLCCIIVIAYPDLLPPQMRFGIVEKLNDLFSGDQELRTVQTRMDSIVYPLQAFWENPLFGVSKSGMSAWRTIAGHGLNTCTPINWFAHYGVFMGVILLSGFGKFFARISKKKWIGIAFWLIFLISISTEAFNYNPTLLCLAFMGISAQKVLLPEATIDENSFD